MDEPPGRFLRFFQELKRRNVYRVAVTYAVVGFILIQVADLTFVRLGLPSWTVTFVIVLVAVGFPLALIVAWAFEMTPEGVRRTPAAEPVEAEGAPGAARSESRLALKAVVGLGIVGLAAAGGWYLVGGGGGTEPRAGDRSIAVLPFEALGKEETGAFTEGMHDALLTRLSNVSGLKVISRTSVQQYRGTNKTTAEIARELGVKWVVEGGVQEMGEQIQVNAQLIDPRTDTHAWAQSYRRDLTAEDLFALQSDITKKIARSLEAELTPEEQEQVERAPTGDLQAYRLYVKGRAHLDTRTGEGIRKAVDYFQRAIRQDSTYALAWSGLADAQGLSYYASDSLGVSVPGQKAAAQRALQLAPELAEAHASMGLVYENQQNGPAALRQWKRAVELKPSYAQAHHWLGWLQLRLGRLRAGHRHASLAVELNPENAAARQVLLAALVARGELDKAEEHLRRGEPLVAPHEAEATILHHRKRWDELERLSREPLKREEGDCRMCRFHLARTAALKGDTASAREHLSQLRQGEETDRRYSVEGLVHAALGEVDAAFRAWQKVQDWGAPATVTLRYAYPDLLGPLRDDPRYEQLVREINTAWGLNPDGSLPDSVDVSFGEQSDE